MTSSNPESKTKEAITLLVKSLTYSLVFLALTALILFLWIRSVPRDTFALVTFLEGGIGFIAGVGISLSNSPSISKTSELLFKTSPWSREAERHAEKIGLKWITTSIFLVLIGAIVSVV